MGRNSVVGSDFESSWREKSECDIGNTKRYENILDIFQNIEMF